MRDLARRTAHTGFHRGGCVRAVRLCTTAGGCSPFDLSIALRVGDCRGGGFPSLLVDLLVPAALACLEEQRSGCFLLVLVLPVALTFMTQFSVVPCVLFTFCFSWKPGKLALQISSPYCTSSGTSVMLARFQLSAQGMGNHSATLGKSARLKIIYPNYLGNNNQ